MLLSSVFLRRVQCDLASAGPADSAGLRTTKNYCERDPAQFLRQSLVCNKSWILRPHRRRESRDVKSLDTLRRGSAHVERPNALVGRGVRRRRCLHGLQNFPTKPGPSACQEHKRHCAYRVDSERGTTCRSTSGAVDARGEAEEGLEGRHRRRRRLKRKANSSRWTWRYVDKRACQKSFDTRGSHCATRWSRRRGRRRRRLTPR
jgi:hypothetical protein